MQPVKTLSENFTTNKILYVMWKTIVCTSMCEELMSLNFCSFYKLSIWG